MRQKIIYRRYFSLNVKKKSGSVAYIPDLSGGGGVTPPAKCTTDLKNMDENKN